MQSCVNNRFAGDNRLLNSKRLLSKDSVGTSMSAHHLHSDFMMDFQWIRGSEPWHGIIDAPLTIQSTTVTLECVGTFTLSLGVII